MARRHGVTSQTIERILLGPGAVFKDYDVATGTGTLLGATRGGNVFTVTRTTRRMEIDGAKGPVKGLSRIVEDYATLQTNLIEITKDTLIDALGGATATDFPDTTGQTHDLIVPPAEFEVSAYVDNIAIVAEMKGKTNPAVVLIKNALGDQGLTFTFPSDDDELVLQVTFTAHYDPDDLDTPPYEIYLPVS